MKSVLCALLLLFVVSGATAHEPTVAQPQPSGIPVYGARLHYEEIGRLYPAPIIVPTEWRHYQYRPTAVGRAVLGPWRVWHTPGPNFVYVPH